MQPKAKNMKMIVLPALATALIVASAAGFAQTSSPRSDVEFVTVQPAGQWSAGQFIGSPVTNEAGENIGDVNDVLFDKTGRVSTAVIGVGGFLGIGEKSVAVPFGALSFTADSAGKRVVTVPLSKERLQAAPAYQPTEKTVYMRAKEQAGELGQQALDKAGELRDKAAKKIEEMTGDKNKN
jgi:sporulation protein YlmC with PRC-barrel domain